MVRPKFFSFEAFRVSSPFDPTFHYVTSPVFSPKVLGALRLIFALYTLPTIIITLVRYVDRKSYFSYFTNLNYIGLTAYFWASAVQTIAFAHRRRRSYPLQTWPRFLQLLHVILHTTVIVYPIIVTIVFWALIASPDTLSSQYHIWTSVSLHVINSAFALFEIALTHIGPSPWTHLVPILVILLGYLGIAYLTRATQGIYTYTFLDPSHGHILVAVYIIGIMVGSCLVFSLVKGACTLRQRISRRYDRFERSGVMDSESTNDWQELQVSEARRF